MADRKAPGPARRALERASALLLVRLAALPAWLVPVLMLGLALVGLIVGGAVGFVAIGLIAIFLGWLALLSWPALRPQQRLLRVAVVGIAAATAVITLLSG